MRRASTAQPTARGGARSLTFDRQDFSRCLEKISFCEPSFASFTKIRAERCASASLALEAAKRIMSRACAALVVALGLLQLAAGTWWMLPSWVPGLDAREQLFSLCWRTLWPPLLREDGPAAQCTTVAGLPRRASQMALDCLDRMYIMTRFACSPLLFSLPRFHLRHRVQRGCQRCDQHALAQLPQ